MADPVVIRTENSLIVWGQEGSYADGNIPATWRRFGLHETATLPDPEMEDQGFWAIGGRDRSRDSLIRGKWSLRGSIPDIRCQKNSDLPAMLAMGIGRTSASPPYVVQEGVTSTDQRLPSMVMQVINRMTDGNTGLTRNYVGGKVNKMTLSASEGEDLRLSFDEIIFKTIGHDIRRVPQNVTGATPSPQNITGGGVALGPFGGTGSGSPSPATDPWGLTSLSAANAPRYTFTGASLSYGSSSGTVTSLCRVKRFSLSIDNMLEPKYYLCNSFVSSGQVPALTLSEIVEGKRQYTLELEMDIVSKDTDLDLFSYMLNSHMFTPDATNPLGGRFVISWLTNEIVPSTMIIYCSPAALTNLQGTVVTKANMNIPAAPAGYMAGTYTFNVDRIQIQCP